MKKRKITNAIEINNTNDDILVSQIEYQAYEDREKKMLNLSLCDNQRADYAGHPSAASKKRYNKNRPAALVQDCERRENDT